MGTTLIYIRKQITDLCGSSLEVDFALDRSGAILVIETMIATLGIRGKGASVGAPAPGKKVGVEAFTHLTMVDTILVVTREIVLQKRYGLFDIISDGYLT